MKALSQKIAGPNQTLTKCRLHQVYLRRYTDYVLTHSYQDAKTYRPQESSYRPQNMLYFK